MKKIITFMFMIAICFLATPVFADTVDCGAISEITRPLAKIIMIAAPILLLVMSAVDILGVVSSGDEKGMKKCWSNLIKRFLICVVILILPILVNIVISWTTFRDLTSCL